MKKVFMLATLIATGVCAEDSTPLPALTVEGTTLTEVSENEVKSADVAEALTKKVAQISLVRRSGIANDIILRGQKKDNINILIDESKIYGACPNRMDPATSHVLSNNISEIEITEGPYDVENFGTLSGSVKITTKKPSQNLEGEISTNFGSFAYQKFAATVSGGSEKIRGLLSLSQESGEQYEDGDGRNFAEQIANFLPTSPVRMQAQYADIDAFEKSTFMGKLYVDVTDQQQFELSYTANRSDNVLYPSSKMDALWDDSDILNLAYKIQDLGAYSKTLEIHYYDSVVKHPMSTFYRLSSGPDSVNEVISYLESEIQGLKLKNAFLLGEHTELTIGLDASNRNWDGAYEGRGARADVTGRVSIDDVDTENRALFVEMDKQMGDLNLKAGFRYDDTDIRPQGNEGLPKNSYDAFNGFITGVYQLNESSKIFVGLGRSSRVPDARELYFRSPMNMLVGTPDLDQTTNVGFDLGIENEFGPLSLKSKLFHSSLDDYIYFQSGKPMHAFTNLDASIFGLEISGNYLMNDHFAMEFSMAWQKGEKDQPLPGQTDTDLAEIPPLKVNIGANYDFSENTSLRLELIAADDWSDFDSDNGEQALDGYAVLNLKARHDLTDNIELTLGVDNIFDETYALSNTYKDLTLLFDGTGQVMLLNEPGRYIYLNAAYRF